MNDFDNELFNACLVKLAKEAKRNQEARNYVENKRQREAIYKTITKDIKFISKFAKKCQNRQTGEKTVFYDIDIIKMPQEDTWGEFSQLYSKYHLLRGHSLNLSMYAYIKQSILLTYSALYYIIPAVKWAYENYVRENFYGKEIEFEEYPGYFIKCKAYQIDWFDEIYIAKEKIKTSFQKKIEDIEEKYKIKTAWKYPKEYEPESWERAWIDYVEIYDIHKYLYNCKDMLMHPENHSEIKDIPQYVKEAEKILHKKIRF